MARHHKTKRVTSTRKRAMLAFRKRSRAAKKGWLTRRKHERAEFRRRSRAAKKGWQNRRIKESAKKKPPKGTKFSEFIVAFEYSYHSQGKQRLRMLDFSVVTTKVSRAVTLARAGILKGKDSERNNLEWAQKIPWDDPEVTEVRNSKADLSKESVVVR